MHIISVESLVLDWNGLHENLHSGARRRGVRPPKQNPIDQIGITRIFTQLTRVCLVKSLYLRNVILLHLVVSVGSEIDILLLFLTMNLETFFLLSCEEPSLSSLFSFLSF